VSWLSRFLDAPRQSAVEELLRESAADGCVAPWSEERASEEPEVPAEVWARAMGAEGEAIDGSMGLSAEEGAVAEAVLADLQDRRPGVPDFPSIALEILERLRDPMIDVAGLARTIERDPALATGVLAVANSAVFRGLSGVETLREAAMRLGAGEVARIAAALSTRSLHRGLGDELEPFGPVGIRLFHHAATVARAGADLARRLELGDPDRVFLGGMLHDVGKPLALRSLAALVREGAVRRPDLAAVERVLHAVHVPVGAEAHRAWGLPPALAAVAEWHHLPEIARGPGQAELHAVRLTSALELLRVAPGVSPTAADEVVTSARALALGPARVQALRGALGQHGAWVKMLFGEEARGRGDTQERGLCATLPGSPR
jgi:putative nucleotidyltransferase with HDIG domain